MRSYFLMIILITNSLSATIDSKQTSGDKVNIPIAGPTAKGLGTRSIDKALLNGTLRYSSDGKQEKICMYGIMGAIGIGSVVCVSLALYATLTKMSMSIY